MKKLVPISVIVLAILLTSIVAVKSKSPKQTTTSQPQSTQAAQPKTNDDILKNALNLYAQKKAEGIDFTNGPCLGTVAPDWVLDIAHNPRLPVDDKVENQCTDFREGRAHHFIELDPDGKLIKMY